MAERAAIVTRRLTRHRARPGRGPRRRGLRAHCDRPQAGDARARANALRNRGRRGGSRSPRTSPTRSPVARRRGPPPRDLRPPGRRIVQQCRRGHRRRGSTSTRASTSTSSSPSTSARSCSSTASAPGCCARQGREHRNALVVNMASMAGKSPQPWLSVYSATKAAVVAYTTAMNKELNAAGVKSVAFCPGFVDTDIDQTSSSRRSWARHAADERRGGGAAVPAAVVAELCRSPRSSSSAPAKRSDAMTHGG